MRLRVIGLVASLVVGSAMADGMPIQNGRFVGTVTVITLTEGQRRQLDRNWARVDAWRRDPKADFGEPIQRIPLTQEQRSQLKKESGKDPALFLFYETRFGENDCTCHAANNALRFSDTQAEIPHSYLKADDEVRQMEKEMEDA